MGNPPLYYSGTAWYSRMTPLPKMLSRFAELVRVVYRRFQEDHGLQVASSLTFTTLLSLVPLITVALALLSAFPVFHGLADAIQNFVFDNLVPESVDVIEKYTEQFVANAGNLTTVGIGFLIVTAILLLLTIDSAFNEIWRVDAPRSLWQRLLIYWAVITLASVGYGDIAPVTPVGRAMTSVMAIVGIGIFAIPAALLASAFSDELAKERDALKANLFAILKDGHIDEEEAIVIRREAQRLHLTIEEVNALIETVIKEHELEERNPWPVHKIAEKPELAVEHFKTLLGQIRQLGVHTDRAEFERIATDKQHLSAYELDLWHKIQNK